MLGDESAAKEAYRKTTPQYTPKLHDYTNTSTPQDGCAAGRLDEQMIYL
jgi:hypothetical protein